MKFNIQFNLQFLLAVYIQIIYFKLILVQDINHILNKDFISDIEYIFDPLININNIVTI